MQTALHCAFRLSDTSLGQSTTSRYRVASERLMRSLICQLTANGAQMSTFSLTLTGNMSTKSAMYLWYSNSPIRAA